MIINFASLSNTTSIMIAYATGNGNNSHNMCLFSVNICLNDQSQQEKSKESAGLAFDRRPSQFYQIKKLDRQSVLISDSAH